MKHKIEPPPRFYFSFSPRNLLELNIKQNRNQPTYRKNKPTQVS
ncbi:MAG: hypothetical protein Q8770_00855 [Sweet potato little leaf phytoplasma]|nr:hypothetical protein [Sweet potato little leaf phytoplasma]